MGRSLDTSRFQLQVIEDGFQTGVGLVCLDCEEVVYGGVGESLGEGEPGDNTLDRLNFIADDHASLYCKGPHS
jgi:hypothetical protein